VQFLEDKRIQGDWTVKSVRSALDRLLSDPEVDLIVALGLIISHEVAARGDLSKPVIAPFILDAEVYGIPLKEGASHVKNFSYVNLQDVLVRDVRSFLSIVKFEKLAYLMNYRYLEAIPKIEVRCRELLDAIGIDLQIIGVGETIDGALSKLSPDIEAVYLGPLTVLPSDEFQMLIDELNKRKLPSFSGFEVSDVERGVLACAISNIYPDIARRAALNIQRILLGEEPGIIPVNITIREQLTINMATVRAINVYPNWSVLTEAELINPERENLERRLNLNSAVQKAIDVNLELAARERFVAAGAQDIKKARSRLLPHVDLSGAGIVVDRDRAEASFGAQPQRSLVGSINISQIVFSEQAWANLSIQKSLQNSREWDFEQLRFDIALAASTAYLNVLRAKTFERIQRNNLRRVRANLDVARFRESVGTAGPAEVYRWESEIATNRKVLIQMNAKRNLAEIELNRILHAPLEEPFLTDETGLSDPVLITNEEKFLKYMENPLVFKVFRGFMVEEGLKSSPELASLDAAIRAQERLLHSASYSFWVPTFALQCEFSNIFSKGGAGTGTNRDLPPLFQFPEIKDFTWSIGLSLSFPLYKGGEKSVIKAKAQKELDYLHLLRDDSVERLEMRIRSSLHLANASHAGIEQALEAVEAAEKSLEVVQEAYSLGTASILDLLDAQNAGFSSEQVAANAVYDFLIDLVEVERSIGRLDFFMSVEERRAFFERAEAYFEIYGPSRERH
jgi:outer membrane protein TolC